MTVLEMAVPVGTVLGMAGLGMAAAVGVLLSAGHPSALSPAK
jgi:hypothetical protein